jgi:hypothetical protein
MPEQPVTAGRIVSPACVMRTGVAAEAGRPGLQ